MPLPPGTGARGGTVLLDGTWQVTWRVTATAVRVWVLAPLGRAARDALLEEAAALAAFLRASAEVGAGQSAALVSRRTGICRVVWSW